MGFFCRLSVLGGAPHDLWIQNVVKDGQLQLFPLEIEKTAYKYQKKKA